MTPTVPARSLQRVVTEDAAEPQPIPALAPGALARRLGPYLARERGQLVIAGVLLAAVVASGLLAPLILGQIVDHAVAARGEAVGALRILPVSEGSAGLWQLAGAFVLAVLGGFALEAQLGFAMARVGAGVVVRLKEDLFRKVLELDPDFFRAHTPGRLIARIESDTQSLKNLFSVSALQVIRGVFTFVGIMAIMFWREPGAAMYVLPLMLALIVGSLFYVRRMARYFRQSRRLLAQMAATIAEQLGGIVALQHYGYTEESARGLREVNLERFRVDNIAAFMNYSFLGVLAGAEALAVAMVVVVAAGQVVAGVVTLGTVIAFIDYLRRIFVPIQQLSEFVSHLQQGAVSAARIFAILSTDHRHPEAAEVGRDAVPFETAIHFEGVRFSYDGRKEVLAGLDLEIPRGAQVALVGPSGGGKSTLVKLLLRFYEPSAGRLAVDGRDLREWSRAAWRQRIGLVLQEVYIFPGTFRENLSVFDPSVADERLLDACELVGLSPLVARLPLGLDTPLSERGANLSHGERQLLSLARALAHDPDVLVLDEATSAVDPVTERRLQRSVEAALAGRTSLVVAHRLSTIERSDRIYVIEDGRVLESGTHQELLADEGHYRELLALQLAEGGGE